MISEKKVKSHGLTPSTRLQLKTGPANNLSRPASDSNIAVDFPRRSSNDRGHGSYITWKHHAPVWRTRPPGEPKGPEPAGSPELVEEVEGVPHALP